MAKAAQIKPPSATATKPRRIYFDLSETQLKGVSIGDVITVRATGKVVGMDAGTPPEKDEKGKVMWDGCPPEMKMELQSVDIEEQNDFSDLAED